MNSTAKGVLFIVLGVLSLLWFGYEANSFLSRSGPSEGNATVSLTLTGLKLIMAITFFVSAIKHFRNKG